MQDIHALVAQVSKLTDEQLQQYAQQHKDNPLIVAAALAESNKRKKMREGAAPPADPNQQPVVDEALSGISALPAPNMETVGMAGGGIVGFAEGGWTEDALRFRRPITGFQGPASGATWSDVGAGLKDFFGRMHSTGAEPAPSDLFPPDTGMNRQALNAMPAEPATPAAPGAAAPVPEAPKKKKGGESRGGPGGLPSVVRAIAKESGNPTAVRDAYKVASIEERMADARKAAASFEDPEMAALDKKALERLAGERDKLLGKEDTVLGMSLLQAGLAMMGSKSRSALGGISEGGLKGLQAFKEGQKELRGERKELDRDERDIAKSMSADRKGALAAGVQIMGQDRQERQYGDQSQLARDTLAQGDRKMEQAERLSQAEIAARLRAAQIGASRPAESSAQERMVERVMAEQKVPYSKALELVYGVQRQSGALDDRALRKMHADDVDAGLSKIPFEQWVVQKGYRPQSVPQMVATPGAARAP